MISTTPTLMTHVALRQLLEVQLERLIRLERDRLIESASSDPTSIHELSLYYDQILTRLGEVSYSETPLDDLKEIFGYWIDYETYDDFARSFEVWVACLTGTPERL